MKLIKVFFVFLFFILIANYCSLSSGIVLADDEFQIDAVVTYKVQENGKTLITHDITIENLFSTLYATNYSLTLENINAEQIKTNSNNKISTTKEGEKTKIDITFNDTVVGRGEKRHFFVSYENSSFATKAGEVWEVSIPKLGTVDNFKNYSIVLQVPVSLGQKAYMSPEPSAQKTENLYNFYTFSKDEITKTGVTAGFGQFQVFSYNISYHLENPLAKSSDVQIALPPDTSFQKVFIEKMEPKPFNVTIDRDGNWIATYKLNPRQRIDVLVAGSVQIFAGFRHFLKPNDDILVDNLKPTTFWQSEDPEIKKLASTLKTPEEIYKYVSTKLKYNYDRVTPNVTRMGALNALKSPEEAICMEFTDLFIAIARAANIPAREINGYAYTENKDLQPLGLVADVLHSWPEYYDAKLGVWIPIDPTWASTTGGEDFFNKLDLRHFTFVIHGANDIKPFAPGSYKLGPNPQKDVFVSFGKLSDERVNNPEIKLANTHSYSIINSGQSAIYSISTKVFFDEKLNNEEIIEVLPPFSKYDGKIKIPFSILGENKPSIIYVEANETKSLIATNKRQTIIYSLVVVLILILVVFVLILVKLGKIRFNAKKIFTRPS